MKRSIKGWLAALSLVMAAVPTFAAQKAPPVTVPFDHLSTGFELDGVDEDKFGFRESVIGRLREVGGNARLFSSPGSGTTVVLEVPR